MRQRVFIQRTRSILTDNAGIRQRPRQRSGPGLDVSRLALIPTGDLRVFTKPERRQYHDYHINLVLDTSGSMAGAKLYQSCIALHGLYHSLVKAGAEVSAFRFNRNIQDIPEKEFTNGSLYRASNSHMRTSNYDEGGWGGGNHDSAAVDHAAELLQRSGKPGKIMLIVSDGQPACSGGMGGCGMKGCTSPYDGESRERSIKKARRRGNVLLGVGIMDYAVLHYYGKGHALSTKNLETVYSSMAKLLERNIKRG